MIWVLVALLILVNIGWYHLFKFMRREYYNKGKAKGLQEAVENIGVTLEQETEKLKNSHVQLPNVPLVLRKCDDHYHVSMNFAQIYAEHVVPGGWETLEQAKRRDFVRYVRKELTDEILKAGNINNEGDYTNEKV